MTIFVAHAQADEEVATSMAKAIERRGNFVEMEQAERIGRPLLSNDVLVLLWSQRMMYEPGRLVMERRALDAWADGKLILVKLDNTFLPVGMRDLETVDATFEQRRTFTWEEVATKVRDAMRPAPQAAEAPPPAAARSRAPEPPDGAGMERKSGPQAPPRAAAKNGGPTGILALILLLFLAAGVGQLLTATTFKLPIGDEGLVFPAWGLLAFAGIWIVVALLVAVMGGRRERPASQRAPASRMEEAIEAPAPATSEILFVSYSHADSPTVVPVVEVVKTNGNEIWMDKAGIQAGDGWAGEIVRAIKGAKGVLVMCSAHAFESDHVKREVYLADRYKKPLLPVFIEPAELPEDFEYFFAGLQWLELHKTPEAERGAALAKAVAAV
jgi:hypothetical protein